MLNPNLAPYDQKPLIQRRLLDSGLYEPDLESVQGEELRRLLQG